jgi:hypothetical protein
MTPSLHSVAFSDWRVDGRDIITLAAARKRRRGDQIGHSLLQCMSPLLAQSGHPDTLNQCPLSGGKADMMRTYSYVCF